MESLFIAISSIRKGCIGKSKSMKALRKPKATKTQILIITSADFVCVSIAMIYLTSSVSQTLYVVTCSPHEGLWYLIPLSRIFQLYRGSQFYWRKKLEYMEKTTDLPQVIDKLLS
jgi:hypothetical protein